MKKTLTTIALAAVLLFGSTFANAGIIVAGVTDDPAGDPCTEADSTGIIVAGFTGIIVAGYTGIIVAGLTSTNTDTVDDSVKSCGIIVAG